MAMTEVVLYEGRRRRTSDYATDLRRMLEILGGYDRPVYQSRPHVVNGVCEGVICQLTLYAHTTSDGRAQPPRHFQARRGRLEDGIQETARVAMLRLARVHAAELAGTAYRFHPAASQLDLAPRQRAVDEEEEDATVVHLARLALAQARHAERTAAELRHAHEALDAAQERIAQLEEAISGAPADDNEREEADDPEQPEEEEPEPPVPEEEMPQEPTAPVTVSPPTSLPSPDARNP